MIKPSLGLAGIILAATTFVAGTADAQQVISRTSDYRVTWSDSAFTGAGALYAASYAYGPSTFSDVNFGINILPNAQNFSYFQGGGVTVSSPAPTPPYPSTTTAVISSDGTSGYWGWQYDTAAGPGGSGLPLTFGRLGNLATLNFNVGGFDNNTYAPPIGYYVFVYLPGDWTTPGTATGDYIFNSVSSGFSTPTFTYDPGTNTTTVETFATSFVTGAPDLNFTLVGTAIPEAPTWAALMIGFVALGLTSWRARTVVA